MAGLALRRNPEDFSLAVTTLYKNLLATFLLRFILMERASIWPEISEAIHFAPSAPFGH